MSFKEESYVARPGSVEGYCVLMSSPFPDTWGEREEGLNIGFAKLRNGRFIYWDTCCPPSPGRQISRLPLEAVPYARLLGLHKEERLFSMIDPQLSLEEVFEGAWVMRGESLVKLEDTDAYPAGVLERLEGGFFRRCNKVIRVNVLTMFHRLSKAMKSFERLGAQVLGFEEDDNEIVECTVEQLAEYFQLQPQGLLAFMTQVASPGRFFRVLWGFWEFRIPMQSLRL